MVMISPQIATMKPAPAESRTSRTGTVWPVGAPRTVGSVVKLYWVLATQIGRWPYPADSLDHAPVSPEQWTLSPHGKPVSLDATFSGHRLPDGRCRNEHG